MHHCAGVYVLESVYLFVYGYLAVLNINFVTLHVFVGMYLSLSLLFSELTYFCNLRGV